MDIVRNMLLTLGLATLAAGCSEITEQFHIRKPSDVTGPQKECVIRDYSGDESVKAIEYGKDRLPDVIEVDFHDDATGEPVHKKYARRIESSLASNYKTMGVYKEPDFGLREVGSDGARQGPIYRFDIDPCGMGGEFVQSLKDFLSSTADESVYRVCDISEQSCWDVEE